MSPNQRQANVASQERVNASFGPDQVVDEIKAIASTQCPDSFNRPGCWDGWILVTVNSQIVTATGIAFEPGDLSIGIPDPTGFGWTVYSLRNGIKTAVQDYDLF